MSVTETCSVCGRALWESGSGTTQGYCMRQGLHEGANFYRDTAECWRIGYEREKARADALTAKLALHEVRRDTEGMAAALLGTPQDQNPYPEDGDLASLASVSHVSWLAGWECGRLQVERDAFAAKLAEAEAGAAALREVLRAAEWGGRWAEPHEDVVGCPSCGMYRSSGHEAGCRLVAALATDAGRQLLDGLRALPEWLMRQAEKDYESWLAQGWPRGGAQARAAFAVKHADALRAHLAALGVTLEDYFDREGAT